MASFAVRPRNAAGPPGRWSRRGFLRLAAGTLAAAGGGALTACGRHVAAVAPQATNAKEVLVWAPWRVGWGASWDAVFYDATAPFREAHPGVDIRIDIGGSSSSNDGALIPQIIAGTAPDVFSGFGPTKMIEGGYTLDLAPFIRSQNLDTSIFDQGEYVKFVRDGVWALPAELSTSAVAVNLGMLDGLGLPYPDPQWTYAEAETLWRGAAAKGATAAKSRVGFVFWGQKATWLPGDFYLRGWGASAAAANFSDRCGLDSPAALEFAQWWYPLATEGVIAWNGAAPPWPQNVACGFAGSWQLPAFAEQRSIKWAFWPQPAWPTGTTAYAGNDYYAVSSTTKHAEMAAAFLFWLTTDERWQRALMELQLVVPPSRKLWAEWEATVKAIAPPLATKNLGAFTEAALQDRAFNHPAFAYDSDSAYGVIGPYTAKIAAGTLSPVLGMRQAADAVNKFEAAAASAASAQAGVQALLQKASGTAAVTFPAPSPTGLGVPASKPLPGYITSQGGVWKLVGDGADVWGASDNCTFAAIPWTSSQGTFTCRITSIANIDCPHLSQWAKVGLMARGNLSDDAPMVLICASGGNGVFTDERSIPGQTPVQQQGTATTRTGLIAAQYLTAPKTAKVSNFLLKPVWLQLRRQGAQWTPYSSLDGKAWAAAGSPLTAAMAGCYVGIFCLSHNSSFGGKGRILATFDNLSFQPTVPVQLGTPGAP
jgi:hypothetical protein